MRFSKQLERTPTLAQACAHNPGGNQCALAAPPAGPQKRSFVAKIKGGACALAGWAVLWGTPLHAAGHWPVEDSAYNPNEQQAVYMLHTGDAARPATIDTHQADRIVARLDTSPAPRVGQKVLHLSARIHLQPSDAGWIDTVTISYALEDGETFGLVPGDSTLELHNAYGGRSYVPDAPFDARYLRFDYTTDPEDPLATLHLNDHPGLTNYVRAVLHSEEPNSWRPSTLTKTQPFGLSAIPESWWEAYGISIADRDEQADLDGDGRTNLEEWLADTDPTSPRNGSGCGEVCECASL